MIGLAAFSITLAVGLVAPAIARSATVMVAPQAFEYRAVVSFVASPGEANDVLVTWHYTDRLSQSITISDSGAVLNAGNQCQSVDPHTVRCTPALSQTTGVIHVDVKLDDENDRLRVSGDARAAFAAAGVIFAVGGTGDDVLDARNAFMAGLDGGGGRDHLYGAAYESVLTDGDRDGAAGDAAPGPDVIEGGPVADHGAGDTLSYAQRTEPVTVDLADARPEGARGEGDIVRAVEFIAGGSGNDRLAGDGHENLLNGGRGRDVLIGRAGRDGFGAFTGSWAAVPPFPGPGVPQPSSAAGDVVACGRGHDGVNQRRASDFTPPTCEWVVVRRAGLRFPQPLPTYPTFDPPSLSYRFACRDAEYRFPRCWGRMLLRRVSGSLLADGRIKRRKASVDVRLSLTPLGRKLAARPRGALARVKFRGRNLPSAGWTIRLRIPS